MVVLVIEALPDLPSEVVVDLPPGEEHLVDECPRGKCNAHRLLGIELTEPIGGVEVLFEPIELAPFWLRGEYLDHLGVCGVLVGVLAAEVELPAPPDVVPVVHFLQSVLRLPHARLS